MITTETDIAPQPVPLYRIPEGTWRVSGSRVSLEQVIEAYKDRETPEHIAETFDTLKLADVYAIISYYLNHTAEVDAYLLKQDEEAETIRQTIEAEMPLPTELRQRILDARARMEAARNGAPGQ